MASKRMRYEEEQIIRILKEVESGTPPSVSPPSASPQLRLGNPLGAATCFYGGGWTSS